MSFVTENNPAPEFADRLTAPPEKVVLPTTDWDAFHDALLNSPEPNAALMAAAHRYRERLGTGRQRPEKRGPTAPSDAQ